MAHHSRLYVAVIDVPADDHDREVAFWQGALGQPLPQNQRFSEYHGALLRNRDFVLLIQRLDEGAARMHVDIHTDDLDAEVARLEGLGATRWRQAHSWWVMQDPAGLPFCVIPDPPGTLTDENSQRWD